MRRGLSRRAVLKAGLAGVGLAAIGGCSPAADGTGGAQAQGDSSTQQAGGNPCGTDYDILRRNLGRTQESISIVGIGGQRMSYGDAPAILNAALDAGINYFDTCRAYNTWEGNNEASWGPVVAQRRDEMFLVSSFDSRTRDGVLSDLDASLAALQTDHLDAYLVHAAYRNAATEVPDGVIQAWEEAKTDGRLRFTGVATHAVAVTVGAYLDRYDFDILRVFTTMSADGSYGCPLASPGLRTRVIAERNLGVLGMKIFTNGSVFAEFPDKTVADFLNYAWDQFPAHGLLVGVETIAELEDDIEAARAYTRSLFPA